MNEDASEQATAQPSLAIAHRRRLSSCVFNFIVVVVVVSMTMIPSKKVPKMKRSFWHAKSFPNKKGFDKALLRMRPEGKKLLISDTGRRHQNHPPPEMARPREALNLIASLFFWKQFKKGADFIYSSVF